MHIGYARVSTDDQHTENQIEQLKKAGCERIYKENASGGRWDRPELHKALEHLRRGDVLVWIKMIRLGAKSQAEIAELFNVDRSTISRMMKEVREKELLKTVR
jgi:DNA invertase Pin-like site-specific DNA recombinase